MQSTSIIVTEVNTTFNKTSQKMFVCSVEHDKFVKYKQDGSFQWCSWY